MPVTINVVDHPATDWTKPVCSSAEELLQNAAPALDRLSKGLVQTSFGPSEFKSGYVSASQNGFVWAAYHAYSKHHHLRIRPEDVWFAIVTQISFYINAHAEELRPFFVAHGGQKGLRAVSDVADFGLLAARMGDLVGQNVADPSLRDWVLPGFSTTTDADTVVGSILFMGAMQKYFAYTLATSCGLPSVTLLGEPGDWEDILRRLDRLDALGDEPRQFAEMLRPVLRRMVQSFSDPAAPEVRGFWNTIVHREELDSGSDQLSGWLVAFCYWDEQGAAKYRFSTVRGLDPDVKYTHVGVDEVPAGYASVPVSVDDDGYLYEATMVAGSVGIRATTSAAPPSLYACEDEVVTSVVEGRSASCWSGLFPGKAHGKVPDKVPDKVRPPICDTVQAVSGWWMFKR